MRRKNYKKKDLKYETNRHKFNFQLFEAIKSLGDSIYNKKISKDEAEMEQTNLLENILDFSSKSRPRPEKDKDKKQNTFDSINALYEGRELILNTFRNRIFPVKKYKEKD